MRKCIKTCHIWHQHVLTMYKSNIILTSNLYMWIKYYKIKKKWNFSCSCNNIAYTTLHTLKPINSSPSHQNIKTVLHYLGILCCRFPLGMYFLGKSLFFHDSNSFLNALHCNFMVRGEKSTKRKYNVYNERQDKKEAKNK